MAVLIQPLILIICFKHVINPFVIVDSDNGFKPEKNKEASHNYSDLYQNHAFSDAFFRHILGRFKCQVARDEGANYDTVCYCYRNHFPGMSEKLHRVGAARLGSARRDAASRIPGG